MLIQISLQTIFNIREYQLRIKRNVNVLNVTLSYQLRNMKYETLQLSTLTIREKCVSNRPKQARNIFTHERETRISKRSAAAITYVDIFGLTNSKLFSRVVKET